MIDWTPTHINSLTASTPAAIRTPAHYTTDRECLERFWPTVGKFDKSEITIAVDRQLDGTSKTTVERNLRHEIEANPNLEIEGGAEHFDFDESGNLHNLMDSPLVGH